MEAESNEHTTERSGAESQPSTEPNQSPNSRLRDLIPEKDPMGAGREGAGATPSAAKGL